MEVAVVARPIKDGKIPAHAEKTFLDSEESERESDAEATFERRT